MNYGAICKHCRHFIGDHDKNGKCHFYHPSINNNIECICDNYELEFGSDFNPLDSKPKSQPKSKYKGFLYETKGIESATMETRDGSNYIIKNGTIHKIKPSNPKRLSPSKSARKQRRTLQYLDKVSINDNYKLKS